MGINIVNKLLLPSLLLGLLSGCSDSPSGTVNAQPISQGPVSDWELGFMVTTANPVATDAAAAILARGGHAVDAAIAAHAVLGLVEPQSSGLGGGGFFLVYQRESGNLRFYDGREKAPSDVGPELFMRNGRMLGYLDAWQSGRAVGVPGTVAVYKLAHDAHGKLPWAELFEPAIELAEQGFVVSPRLATSIARVAGPSRLDENPGAADYFFPGGQALQAGTVRDNPEYAQTLRRIASEGPAAFYSGSIANAIVDAVQQGPIPGSLTVEDMAAYQAVERDVVCGPYRLYTVCSATPPSSGAMQIMIAAQYDHMLTENPSFTDRIRSFVDAQRSVYADRDYYFGDPDRVDIPLDDLLHPEYLEHRANNPQPPNTEPQHGDPGTFLNNDTALLFADDSTMEATGTTHFSIVDKEGNAVSSTMTVESAFGTSRWAAGFVLNNELTDFARFYQPDQALPANAVAPNARPRSSMSPTIVLDENMELFMVTGSPGGNSIPAYTAKTLLGVTDWGMSVQEAVDFPNIIARGRVVRVEVSRDPGPELAEFLSDAGYQVQQSQGENSGLSVIVVTDAGLVGAADPRREGTVRTTAP